MLLQYPFIRPHKRQRRTATAVMAGDFDVRPARDVLTSLLNGVPSIKVDKTEQAIAKKAEKRERKRARQAAREEKLAQSSNSASTSFQPPVHQPAVHQPSSFWKARPAIHIPVIQRSVSISPPPSPMLSGSSTPQPSHSSSTSRTSSKRPRTPNDDYPSADYNQISDFVQKRPIHNRPKREPPRKGWKGWVEGSPPPSEKLINLDAVPILRDRRTRSGKNFDALSVGKEGWV